MERKDKNDVKQDADMEYALTDRERKACNGRKTLPASRRNRKTTPNHNSTRRQKSGWTEKRAITIEPLPPPPPPPPEDEDVSPRPTKLRKSLSSPSLSQLAKMLSTLSRNDEEFIIFQRDCDVTDIKSNENDDITSPGSGHQRSRAIKGGRDERVARDNATLPEKREQGQCSFAQDDNLVCADAAELKLSPQTERDRSLMHEILESDRELDSINIDLVGNDDARQQPVKAINKENRANLPTDQVKLVNQVQQSDKLNTKVLGEEDSSLPIALSNPNSQNSQSLRPTSLFKPGQPKIFFPGHRVSFPNTGAIQRLAEYHQSSANDEMSTYNPRLDVNRRRRRKRPLPAIPQEQRSAPQHRDIGVMTPGNMDDTTTILTDLYSPMSATPLTLASTLTALTDRKGSMEFVKSKKCFLGGKCKVLLLLIPSLIAIATTVVLVLFLLGIIGTTQSRESELKGHVTTDLYDTTEYSLNQGHGRNVSLPTDDVSKTVLRHNDTIIESKPSTKRMIVTNQDESIPVIGTDRNDVTNTDVKPTTEERDVKTGQVDVATKPFQSGRGKSRRQNKNSRKNKGKKNRQGNPDRPAITMATKALSHKTRDDVSNNTIDPMTTGSDAVTASTAVKSRRRSKSSKSKSKMQRRRQQNRDKQGKVQVDDRQNRQKKHRGRNMHPVGGMIRTIPILTESREEDAIRDVTMPSETSDSLTAPVTVASQSEIELINQRSAVGRLGPRERLQERREFEEPLSGPSINGARQNTARDADDDHSRITNSDSVHTNADNSEYDRLSWRGQSRSRRPADLEYSDSYYDDTGSGFYNEFSTDDEDEIVTCQINPDPVCDAVLPYTTSWRNLPHDATQSKMTSLIVRDLRRDDVGSRFNQSSCDPENALRFLCALQFPTCIQGSSNTAQLPCHTWCVNVLSSCLDRETLLGVETLRHRDVTGNVRATQVREKTSAGGRNTKSRKRQQDVAQFEEPIRSRNGDDVTDLVSYACNVILTDDVGTTNCFDISANTSDGDQPTTIETTVASCGEGRFMCLNGGCIDRGWVCDGNNDCGEREDEIGCRCEYDEIQCSNGQCVKQHQECDGFHDCFDRSDERNCVTCGKNLTSCGDDQCILTAWWCDGDVDCGNGRDELDCSCETQGLLTCDVHTCIPPRFMCDGDDDCSDASDERDCYDVEANRCEPWMMTCDHSCLSMTKQCDGILDCVNGEDENDCGTCEAMTLQTCVQLSYNVTMLPNFVGHMTQAEITMSSEYVLLTSIVHTRCHPLLRELGCSILAPPVPLVGASCQITGKNNRRHRVLPCRGFCEEVRDSCLPVIVKSNSLIWPAFLKCSDFPVKTNESVDVCFDSTTLSKGICSSDEFRCTNGDSDETQCVTMTSRCDGKVQCSDGSDEMDCNCAEMKRFQCKSGDKCVAMEWMCDSHSDCPDGSDEHDCSNCSTTERSCSDYSCVSTSQWCDGNDDCQDGSDETHCLMLLPQSQLHNARVTLRASEDTHSTGVLVGYNPLSSEWVPVCSDSWDALFSHLACNQMGYSDALSHNTVPYFELRHHLLRHQPIKVINNHRVRRIQETFLQREESCVSEQFVQITCRPRSCGRRRDATDNGRIIPRILGGRTSRFHKWPWMVSLTLPGMNHVCGATLVRSQWLISAAHCFQERKDVRIWTAKVLGIKSTKMSAIFHVSKIIIHPRYDSQAVDFDVALVKLDRPIRSSKVEPLCLPSTSFHPGSYCVIAGWGITGKSMRGAHKLQEGYVHVISRSTCQRYYPNHVISNRMICAGHAGTVDACSGDSGGPLMCWQPHRLQWQLAGVTSWGSSCTPHSAPGVYTDVKYFSEWAETTMEQRDFG